MKLLITTGATVTFKPLVRLAVLPPFLDLLAEQGVTDVVIQYGNHVENGHNLLTQFVNECLVEWAEEINSADGRATYVYRGSGRTGRAGSAGSSGSAGGSGGSDPGGSVAVELMPFSANLGEYIAASDVVVSHGGTGTILDVLRGALVPLIVVYNEELMDNHQREVSEALEAMGHCVSMGSRGLSVATFGAVLRRVMAGEIKMKPLESSGGAVLDVLYGELARARGVDW